MIQMDPALLENVPLDSAHIADALRRPEAPASLYLCYLNLTEITNDVVQQLVSLESDDDNQTDGAIHRIALSNNNLRTLPPSFSLLQRLRYLNLRSNALSQFPEVLSDMDSLEILDLSRNKIKSFPTNPGTLLNIRVLHMGRNRITALPSYFPSFQELNLMMIGHNPIEWPPPHVLKASAPSSSADALVAERWVRSIQGWIRDHLTRYGRPTQMGGSRDEITAVEDAFNGTGDGLRVEENGRHSIHDRTPSNDSVISQYSNFSQSDTPDSPRDERIVNRTVSKLMPPDAGFDGYSSSDLSASIDGLLQPLHSRNASLTYSKKQNGTNGLLQGKKSLPELRSMHLRPERGKTRGRPPLPTITHNPNTDNLPSLTSHLTARQSSLSKGSSSDTGHTIRPPRSMLRDEDANGVMDGQTQPPPMDGERNAYFKRMSMLPASTISKSVPQALLVTVDAARGILFALSQIYSALRHYIIFAINDRLSSVLNKVLDPAWQYLSRLITALDRFDTLCRSGTPSPAACRGILESCRDNITVFTKVIGVVQIQLKVLAGNDDVRYTRTLLLMLYGSAAELSNSWAAISPNLEEMRSLVRDNPGHAPTLSISSASGGNTPVGQPMVPRATQTIPENDEPSANSTPRQGQPPSATRPRPPPQSAERRRQGGSFSANDVRKGKAMPTIGRERDGSISSPLVSAVQPLQIKATSAASKVLKNHIRPTPGGSSPRSNQGHSPSLSSSSHGHGGVLPYTREDTPHNGGLNGTLSSDKDKFVDADTLSAMEESTDLALRVWKQLEDLFEMSVASNETGNGIGREYLMKARDLTMALKSNIRAVLDGADGEVYGAALWEGANTFSKDVATVLKYVMKLSTEGRIRLEPSLRSELRELSHSTQEFLTFLSVSSFAASKPPPSPAPSSFTSPAVSTPAVSTPGFASPSLFSAHSASYSAHSAHSANFPSNGGYSSPSPYDERIVPNSANPIASGFGSSDLMPPSAPLWRSRSANVVGASTPPPGIGREPMIGRGESMVGRGVGVGGAMAGGGPMQWSGPAHPSLRDFRMPGSPVPGPGRIRPSNGGVVGYRESD